MKPAHHHLEHVLHSTRYNLVRVKPISIYPELKEIVAVGHPLLKSIHCIRDGNYRNSATLSPYQAQRPKKLLPSSTATETNEIKFSKVAATSNPAKQCISIGSQIARAPRRELTVLHRPNASNSAIQIGTDFGIEASSMAVFGLRWI